MFKLKWTKEGKADFLSLENQANKVKNKNSKQKGLFKQVVKTLKLLTENPRHPGLNTHGYISLEHPWSEAEKVFEAYVQNKTPGAYRVFWCYGPQKKEITIIGISPHP